MTLSEKISAPGPKRILALDGGGIRGIITLEILAKIESLLREQSGRQNDFRLADYFDFIAGTSTGAIIGVALSLGMTVADIRSFYLETGREMFEQASVLRRPPANTKTGNSPKNFTRCSGPRRPWGVTDSRPW